jgi:GNAT superfamily N-acetyltransferase
MTIDIAAALAAFDEKMRRDPPIPGPDWRVERLTEVTRLIGPSEDPIDNTIVWSGLDADNADEVIAREAEYFGGIGRAVEWKLYAHDQPVDLPARLVSAGFLAEPAETLMAASLADAAWTRTDAPELPSDVEIFKVRDASALPLIDELNRHIYPDEDTIYAPVLAAEMAATPDQLSVYLALAGDLPVAAGWMRFHPGTGFADLWGGGTHPHWRGKGLYRTLVALRAAEARQAGAGILTVDASPESRPILERLGFVALTTTTPYVRDV